MLKMANFPFPASSLTSAQKDSSKGASADKKKLSPSGVTQNYQLSFLKYPLEDPFVFHP